LILITYIPQLSLFLGELLKHGGAQ
jgi:hypothetical protein